MHNILAVMFLMEEKDAEGKELQSRGLRKSVWFAPIFRFIDRRAEMIIRFA